MFARLLFALQRSLNTRSCTIHETANLGCALSSARTIRAHRAGPSRRSAWFCERRAAGRRERRPSLRAPDPFENIFSQFQKALPVGSGLGHRETPTQQERTMRIQRTEMAGVSGRSCCVPTEYPAEDPREGRVSARELGCDGIAGP
jgi:hypothetical protein